MSKKFTRRDFLKFAATGAGGVIVAACSPTTAPTPETITVVETKIVEVAGEKVVETDDLMSLAEQTLAEVRSEKASSSGDQDAHGRRLGSHHPA